MKCLEKVGNHAFLNCGGLNEVVGLEQYMTTPTPIPTATPTPTPNPEKPRLLGSYKAGDDVTREIYDNGTVYFKGTGEIYDYGMYEVTYIWRDDLVGLVASDNKPLYVATKLVVEEGITRIGELSLMGKAHYITSMQFPSTLTSVGNFMGVTFTGVEVTGYTSEGKKKEFAIAADEMVDTAIGRELGITVE